MNVDVQGSAIAHVELIFSGHGYDHERHNYYVVFSFSPSLAVVANTADLIIPIARLQLEMYLHRLMRALLPTSDRAPEVHWYDGKEERAVLFQIKVSHADVSFDYVRSALNES